MVRFGKKAALLAMAGVLTAASVTGCSGAIDAEATVVTVGKEKVPLGVVNFYARMMQDSMRHIMRDDGDNCRRTVDAGCGR